MRTLFDKPIRKGITDEFFPNKIDINEFKYIISDAFDAYAENMQHINADAPKYIEQWVEQYLSWLDIEQE